MTRTTVKLISSTNWVKETIFALWKASRTNHPILSAVEYYTQAYKDPILRKEIDDTFAHIMASHIPVGENVYFCFLLENVPISLREQMVRHRVGHHFGQRLGVDIIPDLPHSSWWSQTMRVTDMSNYAEDENYHLPQSIQDHPDTKNPQPGTMSPEQRYRHAMKHMQYIYRGLLASGIPPEDARNVLPLACTHRISWTLNLVTLQHLIGKRSCWIAQAELWGPVITGMIDELSTKVWDGFRRMADPPCIGKDGCFSSCVYQIENKGRTHGQDPGIPCSLYLANHQGGTGEPAGEWKPESPVFPYDFTHNDSRKNLEMFRMREYYKKFWGRDPDTGEVLPQEVDLEPPA